MSTVLTPENFGIIPGTDVATPINKLFESLSLNSEEKTLTLQQGTYYLDVENVPTPTLYITNTVGDNEWHDGEIQHRNAVGLLLQNVENFTLDGNGSTFVVRGQMTNVALIDCKNVTLKNFKITVENPDMHELKVVKKGFNYVDFALDKESTYKKEGKTYFFTGKDYKSAFGENKIVAWWIGKIPADDQNTIFRTRHPLSTAMGLKEIAPYTFRASYFVAPNYKVGDAFYIFDNRRKFNGIYANRCENVSVLGVTQHFNYGLATVFQDCENVTVSECRFAPAPDSVKKMISVADFVQVSTCRGLAKITDNYFEGAGDDCLNVHGIHFSISAIDGKRLTLKFRHKQTHGFCPFRAGDKLRIINSSTLLPIGENEVESAELIDEQTIILTAKLPCDKNYLGEVVENASSCPDVEFSNNTLNRIITRGILLTTSGKVIVDNNRFMSNSMHSVLISDDAKHWFESGFVSDVTVSNNYFGRCVGYTLFVKPENTKFAGHVHKNIKFINNTIESANGQGGYFVKDSDNVVISGNTVKGKILPPCYKNSNVKEN